jgi:hypothetical protein
MLVGMTEKEVKGMKNKGQRLLRMVNGGKRLLAME